MSFEIRILETAKKDVKKLIKKYPNIKNDLKSLIKILQSNPKAGVHIGENFYKIRMRNSSSKKGKRGGFRVIYYLELNNEIWILKVYSKNEIENLSDKYILSLLKG